MRSLDKYLLSCQTSACHGLGSVDVRVCYNPTVTQLYQLNRWFRSIVIIFVAIIAINVILSIVRGLLLQRSKRRIDEAFSQSWAIEFGEPVSENVRDAFTKAALIIKANVPSKGDRAYEAQMKLHYQLETLAKDVEYEPKKISFSVLSLEAFYAPNGRVLLGAEWVAKEAYMMLMEYSPELFGKSTG